MSEPAKQQMGDGRDNFGQAAGKAAQAAKQASKEVAKQAAAKGAEATANAAASTVKAGVEGGKAVAEIAAGTASGGPWGAIISAAWAMRHTLYKILICICLVLVFLIVLIASLPSIIWDYLTHCKPIRLSTGTKAFLTIGKIKRSKRRTVHHNRTFLSADITPTEEFSATEGWGN